MKFGVIILFVLMLTGNLFGQVSSEKRVEIELKDNYENEHIIEFGSEGLVLFAENSEAEKGTSEWKYDLYDTDLTLQKSVTVKLDKNLYPTETEAGDDAIYSFYKDYKGNYTLVTVKIPSMEVVKKSGQLPKGMWLDNMKVSGEMVYLQATVKKDKSIMAMNSQTGKFNIFPIQISGAKPKATSIEEFQVIEKNKELFVYVSHLKSRREQLYYLLKLDQNGKFKEKVNLSEGHDQNIISASASVLDDNKYIVVGTYSSSSAYASEGLFFSSYSNNKLDFMKRYNFLDLKDFLSYLPEGRQERIEKKKKRKEEKGKELKFNYRIVEHEVIPLKDGYILLGEAYYPTYRTESYTTYTTVNGTTTAVTHYRQVFDGYQYTHAFIAKFGLNGEIVWDRTFEMYLYQKPFSVKKFIEVNNQTDTELSMVYTNWHKIMSKSVSYATGEVLKEKVSDDIEQLKEGDKARYSTSSLQYWYDNYYVAYGMQKIKNKEDKDVKRKRKVYFISKIKY